MKSIAKKDILSNLKVFFDEDVKDDILKQIFLENQHKLGFCNDVYFNKHD